MADFKITNVFTAHPPENMAFQNTFYWETAFGIAIEIAFSDDVVNDSVPFEIQLQLVCVREDPDGYVWWRTSDYTPKPTIDFTFPVKSVSSKKAQFRVFWPSYGDLMQAIGGGDVPGVFAVRACVRSTDNRGMNASFDMTAPFAATYHYIGHEPPPTKPPSGSGGAKPHPPPPASH